MCRKVFNHHKKEQHFEKLTTEETDKLMLKCRRKGCSKEFGKLEELEAHFDDCDHQEGIFLCGNFPVCKIALPNLGEARAHTEHYP